jgi:hypothetical protein
MAKYNDDTTTAVVTGFTCALLDSVEGNPANLAKTASLAVLDYVETYLSNVEGIDWEQHGDSYELGAYLYLASEQGCLGFLDGSWGDVGEALDAPVVRMAWSPRIDSRRQLVIDSK